MADAARKLEPDPSGLECPIALRTRTQGLATPAGRIEFLLDLYAPLVEQEDGTYERDPSCGLISREQVKKLMERIDG